MYVIYVRMYVMHACTYICSGSMHAWMHACNVIECTVLYVLYACMLCIVCNVGMCAFMYACGACVYVMCCIVCMYACMYACVYVCHACHVCNVCM